MRSSALALALGLLAGCTDEGTAIEKGCKRDSDCPRAEMKCVVGAGVCVGFATPLDVPDGVPPDGGPIDAALDAAPHD